jgi:hypothetical protein
VKGWDHSLIVPSGHNPEPWAAGLKWKNYELLCPNGARAEVNQFKACNLAQIPSHAIMVRPDTNIYTVFGLLDKAQVSQCRAYLPEGRVATVSQVPWSRPPEKLRKLEEKSMAFSLPNIPDVITPSQSDQPHRHTRAIISPSVKNESKLILLASHLVARISLILVVVFLVLGIKPRTLHIVGKRSPTPF